MIPIGIPIKRLLFFFLLILYTLVTNALFAQVSGDSNRKKTDSIPGSVITNTTTLSGNKMSGDSLSFKPANLDQQWKVDINEDFQLQVLNHHNWYRVHKSPVHLTDNVREYSGNDVLFYALISLLLFFGIIRITFFKYFNDLFNVFFNTILKQRQVREQLMQSPIPSFFFNLFFVATTGLYISFLLSFGKWIEQDQFWLYVGYCCLGLSVIYIVKVVVVYALGLLFNVQKGAAAYIFVVMLVNKMIGFLLLPILFFLAYSQGVFREVVLMISWLGIGLLLIYRLILGSQIARKEIKFNIFYFILYFMAFEVAPLLLIYRLLIQYFK